MHEIAAELNVKVDDLLSWQHDFAASQHQSLEEASKPMGISYSQLINPWKKKYLMGN